MCKFFSSIVTRQGDILYNEYTDSHEDLVDHFSLKDNSYLGNFVRCEFVPADNRYADVDSYSLKVDETSKPEWFVEIEDSVKEKMRGIVSRMVIREDKKILIGGCYILDSVKIGKVKNVLIKSMLNSQINDVWENSQIEEMRGNSQINKMFGNSRIGRMLENSQIDDVWENSQIGEMEGNSQISKMLGNSLINEMWGNSLINMMWGFSRVNKMWDNSQIYEMSGYSQVYKMEGNSQVYKMEGNSRIHIMGGSSQIHTMGEGSIVDEMWGNSQVKVNDKEMIKKTLEE